MSDALRHRHKPPFLLLLRPLGLPAVVVSASWMVPQLLLDFQVEHLFDDRCHVVIAILSQSAAEDHVYFRVS